MQPGNRARKPSSANASMDKISKRGKETETDSKDTNKWSGQQCARSFGILPSQIIIYVRCIYSFGLLFLMCLLCCLVSVAVSFSTWCFIPLFPSSPEFYFIFYVWFSSRSNCCHIISFDLFVLCIRLVGTYERQFMLVCCSLEVIYCCVKQFIHLTRK